MVNNFPLSLLSFNVNLAFPADELALVTVITPPSKPWFTEITAVFYINQSHPTFSSKFSTLNIFLGPKFSTLTPKHDCNFGTLCHPLLSPPPLSSHSVTMFVLAKLQDVVRIPPWQFDKPLTDAITEELNRKLSNRVLYSVGLCIALHDITKLEESFILPGDGASHSKTTFRYVVFRPYVDEVLTGKIKSCSSDGVQGEKGAGR